MKPKDDVHAGCPECEDIERLLAEASRARRELGEALRRERDRQYLEDVRHARREEAAVREPRTADGRYVGAWERWLG